MPESPSAPAADVEGAAGAPEAVEDAAGLEGELEAAKEAVAASSSIRLAGA